MELALLPWTDHSGVSQALDLYPYLLPMTSSHNDCVDRKRRSTSVPHRNQTVSEPLQGVASHLRHHDGASHFLSAPRLLLGLHLLFW